MYNKNIFFLDLCEKRSDLNGFRILRCWEFAGTQKWNKLALLFFELHIQGLASIYIKNIFKYTKCSNFVVKNKKKKHFSLLSPMCIHGYITHETCIHLGANPFLFSYDNKCKLAAMPMALLYYMETKIHFSTFCFVRL